MALRKTDDASYLISCLFPFLSERLGLFDASYESDVNGWGDAKMARTLFFYTDLHAILARGPAIYGGLMRQKVLETGDSGSRSEEGVICGATVL